MEARLSRLPPERRAQILAAIAAEIADRGLEGASVAGIARRAGGSKASLFYYFPDRDAMVLAAATAFLEEVLGLPPDGAPPPFPSEPAAFWAVFEAMYLGLAERLSKDPVRARFARVWIDAMARDAVPGPLRPLVERTRAVMSQLVAAGLSCGALRSDVPRPLLERALFALALGVDAWMAEAVLAGEPVERAAGVVLALVRSAFAAP